MHHVQYLAAQGILQINLEPCPGVVPEVEWGLGWIPLQNDTNALAMQGPIRQHEVIARMEAQLAWSGLHLGSSQRHIVELTTNRISQGNPMGIVTPSMRCQPWTVLA